MEVSDRVVLMNRGEIEQVGSPQQVWDQPASPFVFGFLGHVNQLQGYLAGGAMLIGNGPAQIACPALIDAAPGQAAHAFVRPYEFDVRPSRLEPSNPGHTSMGWITGRLVRTLATGPLVRLEVEPDDAGLLAQGELLEVHLSPQDFAALQLNGVESVDLRPRTGQVFAT